MGGKSFSGKNGQWTPNKVRERMRVAALVRRLQKFALGEKGDQGEEINLNAAQVRAIEILLKKAIPDLSSVEYTGEMTHRFARDLTDDELASIAAGSSAGTADTATGPQEPPAVH